MQVIASHISVTVISIVICIVVWWLMLITCVIIIYCVINMSFSSSWTMDKEVLYLKQCREICFRCSKIPTLSWVGLFKESKYNVQQMLRYKQIWHTFQSEHYEELKKRLEQRQRYWILDKIFFTSRISATATESHIDLSPTDSHSKLSPTSSKTLWDKLSNCYERGLWV